MGKRIAWCDGHGMETPGKRTPLFQNKSFMHENEFNRAVGQLLDSHLIRCGFETLNVAPGDMDVPLTVRTKAANDWKADFYISIHANAMTGAWGESSGIETYHYPGSVKSKQAAEIIHKHLIGGTALKDRGVKTANFHVLRETNMPAVLVECGFMDNLQEAELLLAGAYRSECAEEIAKGICEYLGVDWIPERKMEPMKYTKTLFGTHIIEIDPMALTSRRVKNTAKDLSKTIRNFVNGMFFDFNSDTLYRWLIVAGQVISSRPVYDTQPKGTFLISNSGKVSVQTLLDAPCTNTKLAFQGFNLDYEANGSKALLESMRKEGWCYQDKATRKWIDHIYTSVNLRPAIGYNAKKNKIILVLKNTDATGIRKEIRAQGCVDAIGNTVGIGLDSGGSTAICKNGKIIHASDRTLKNILIFE